MRLADRDQTRTSSYRASHDAAIFLLTAPIETYSGLGIILNDNDLISTLYLVTEFTSKRTSFRGGVVTSVVLMETSADNPYC
jgi:hypothetical protein